MDINKADRATLKAFFKKNAVPTESNFADLIDGMINQKDDGIAKLPGDPLSIAAAGDTMGPQKLVNFYGSLSDSNPAWTLLMNPRSDQNNPATAKAGFSVSDGLGASKLFIDKSTGNIGLGTISHAARLDIANLVRLGLDEGGSGTRTISFARDAGDEGNAGKIAYKGGFGGNALNITGAGAPGAHKQINLYDDVIVAGALQVNAGINNASGLAIVQTNANDWLRINPASQFPGIALFNSVAIGQGGLSIGDWSQLPKGNLKVVGAMTPSAGNTEANGILFPKDPGGGGGDAGWLRYYPRSGEKCTLELGISNDPDDTIALMPSGGVGIGTNTPDRSLTIANATGANYLNVKDGTHEILMGVDAAGGILSVMSNHDLCIRAGSNSEKMRVTAAGNVGIGTTTPNAKLEVAGSGGYTIDFIVNGRLKSNNNDGGLWVAADRFVGGHSTNKIGFWNGGAWQLTVQADGNVGLGMVNPQTTLDIHQRSAHSGIRLRETDGAGNETGRYMNIAYEGQGNIHFYHQSSLGQWMDPSGNWHLNSDVSLKQDIAAIENILDKVLRLVPVSFKWRQNQCEDIGFIAQDVEAVFPQLVSSISVDGKERKGLPYSTFGVLAIAAIKELVQTYEQRLQALEHQLLALSKK